MINISTIKGFFYWHIYQSMMKLCIHLFYFLPIKKNKIVLMHDSGEGYGDSPKYMAEEIMRRGLPYDLVWLVKDMDMDIPISIRKVHIGRICSVYELATAKIIVTTLKTHYNFKKKSSQFVFYVPHGQIGAKYVERQAEKILGKEYPKNSKWHSSVCDLFLSSSKLFTEEMLTWYWYDNEVWESGLPRNDIFFNYTQEDVTRIKQTVGAPSDVKIAFYAPTFRDNGDNKAYALDANRLLQTLKKKTGDKWMLLVRLHPCFMWFKKPIFEWSSAVRDVTAYPDMQDLLLISDILISDYSSTMFDFNLLHRPILLFTKDIESYQQMRGLKDWFFKVPFPFCHNNDELIQTIEDFDTETYQKKCKDFDKLYGSMEDGKATQRVVDRIETIMV